MGNHDPAIQTVPVPVSELGEGPVWDRHQQRIIWVDVLTGKIQEYYPGSGQYKTFEVGEMVGSVGVTSKNRLIAALQHGFALVDVETKTIERLGNPESHLATNRFNDGKCDPAGRFWAGTMSMNGTSAAGALYALQHKKIKRKITGVGCSNGLAWSLDHKTFYFIDTPARRVMAFEYNSPTGEIKNGKSIISFPGEEGLPDGMTIDGDGMLWIALWNGWKLQRWNPVTSTLLQEFQLPVALVTSCTFGGENLEDLYITTAHKGLSELEKEKQRLAGSLFVIKKCGYKGVPAFSFRED